MAEIRLILGDCIEVMRGMAEGDVDAILVDPPYGLEFMGKEWDRLDVKGDTQGSGARQQAWHEQWLREAFRILPPGGVIKAFSGTRTFHRLAAAMEFVGFELVPGDSLDAWVYGSGFPKSLNIQKNLEDDRPDEAKRFSGYGTALKPAWEPVLIGRKPHSSIISSTLARAQVLDVRPIDRSAYDYPPYNPFEEGPSLKQRVLAELLSRPKVPLLDLLPFFGEGAYLLYYHGRFLLYRPLVLAGRPLYGGKAVSPGRRKGLRQRRPSRAVYRRLMEHAQSIAEAHNLRLEDFSCQWIVCSPELPPEVVEKWIFQELQLLWVAVVDGFGNHTPGEGRKDQKRSRWDTVHKGRKWVDALGLPFDPALLRVLEQEIRSFLRDMPRALDLLR